MFTYLLDRPEPASDSPWLIPLGLIVKNAELSPVKLLAGPRDPRVGIWMGMGIGGWGRGRGHLAENRQFVLQAAAIKN